MSKIRTRTIMAAVALALCPAAFAQGNSEEGRLRALNAQALQLAGALHNADDSQQAAVHSQAGPVFAQRQALLQALIATQPAKALELAFPADVLDDFSAAFPEAVGNLEQRGKWQGELYHLMQDGVGFTTHKDVKQLKISGQMVDLFSNSPVGTGSKCGETVAASGVRSGNKIVAESSTVVAPAAACSPTGAQKVVVLLVNFLTSKLPANITPQFVQGVFLGNAASGETVSPDVSISDFWSQNSDAKSWVNNAAPGALTVITVNLTQEYTYCSGSSDNSGPVRQAAYAAADPFINYNDYSRAILILPNNNSCPGWAGIGTIGCWGSEAPGDGASNYSWAWWRADQVWNRGAGVNLGTHEMGHNLGMNHASSRSFATEPVGPPGAGGTLSEYGDNFSTMGFWNYGFYSAAHAFNVLGWLSNSNVLPVTTTGTYTLQPYDQNPEAGVVKALKIARGTGTTNSWFYVAYYPSDGLYLSQLNANIHGGAIIHYQDPLTAGGYSNLVAFTPPVGGVFTPDFNNPVLQIGQTWTDPYTDVQIAVDSVVNNALNVTVTFNPPPCTVANPTVTISPTSASVSQGGSKAFTVTATSHDSSTCGARYFNLTSSIAPSGAAGMGAGYSLSTLPIAPGASGSSTLNITTTSATAANTYTINATATSLDSNANVGSTNPNAGLTVTVPPLSAPSGFSATGQYTGTGKTKKLTAVKLAWTDNSTTETSFTLQRCKPSGKGANATCTWGPVTSVLGTATTGLMSYIDTTMAGLSGTYKYEIQAVGPTNSSAWVVIQATF